MDIVTGKTSHGVFTIAAALDAAHGNESHGVVIH
jgi:hypothetical protein